MVNNELANILGYEKSDELLSKNISDFYFSAQEREKLIEKYDKKESSEVKNIEVKFRKKDSSPIWVLMTARAIKDENYETISYDGFIIDISVRKNYELKLISRIEIEEIINEISTQFAQGIYLDTDKHIHTAIKKIGLFTQVDRVYIFQFENNGTLMTNTHEWCNNGVEPQIDNLQHLPVDIFPWWMDKLNKFEIINYEFIADFPVEAKAEQNVLEEQGIISILVLPMLYEGQLIGFVGFDSVKSNKKWIEHDINVLETLSGLISGVISRAKRIHELKRAKALAEEGQKRYKSLFYENSSVMLLIDPKTGDIVDANNAACNYYGYSNQQLTSLKISQINTLSEAEIQVEMQKALNQERLHFDFKHRLASGEIRDVESYSGKVSVAGNDLLYSIVHDVTERKLAEEKVLKLSSAIEQSSISILITNTTGSIEYVNPYFSQLTGYSSEEFWGKNPRILNSGIQSSQFYKKMWNTILKGGTWEGEICNKKKNGELFWELAKISPIIDSKGEITHFVGIKEDITEKRNIEKKIRFLADSLEQVGECVSITDKEDIILYVNRAFCITYGYSNTELVGQHIGILQPDNIQQSELMQLLTETRKGNWKGELINKRKDKSLFPILLSTSVITDEKNNEIAYIGVAMDITEMKKSRSELIAAKEKSEESESALKHSRDLMRYIIEHNRSAIAVHDKDYRYIFVSQRYLQEYQVKEKDILGKHHYEVFPDLPQKWRDVHKKALMGEISSAEDDPYYKEDGTVVWTRWECRPWYEKDNSIGGFIVYTEVITERKNLELNLKAAKEKAEENERKLIEANEIAKLGSWELDIETGIFTFTDNLYKIFHTSALEIGGYQMTIENYAKQFVHPEDASLVAEETQKAIETNDPNFSHYIEHRILYKDGGPGYMGVRFFIIKDESGKTIKTFGVNQDITERKIAELELIKAKEKAEESDRLKSAFLANMSHEIRTPMNGILGFTGLLLEPDLSDETKEQYIQIIHQSGERMLNTVTDIVEISKIEAGIVEVRKSEINVTEVVKSILKFFQVQAQKKGLNLIYQNENLEIDIILTTDKAKFESIFSNLIKNAIKFTEKGNITISCCFKNGFIEFCVKDTGIGIPKQRQAAIFNRFEQADIEDTRVFEGSGLGLAIAKSYVEMLGGEIWVESIETKGSEFYFTIPIFIIEKDRASNSKQESKEKRFNRQYKILIVEDDEISAIYLKTILNDIAKEITHVDTGERAIEECKNQDDFDVILMDIKMPGISGFEATKRIREFNKEVIIIAQTAYALSGDREKAISSGCNDYITKPVKENEILEKIEKNIKNCI